jgi:hypothetical protein
MSRSPRRPRRRRHRAPAPRPDLDPHELLSILAEVRGTAEAQPVWRELADQFWNGASWRDVDPVMRMIQAMGDAGLFSEAERFFLLGNLSDAVVPSRASEDPRFSEVEEEIERVRSEHGLSEDEDWYLHEASQEYRELNEEWRAIADREMARWYESLGEWEMARLIVRDRVEFESRWDEGRRELFGVDEP